MAPTLGAWLGRSLRFGPLQMCGSVVIAPLVSSEPGSELLGLEQALALGAVAKELPEPVVSRIVVVNPTDTPILLLDGEEIVGAQQNRIIDGTVIVPAASERVVAVCCVEEGRWERSMRKEAFRTSTQVAPASLRSVKSRTGRGRTEGDQDAVWTQVRMHVEGTRTITRTTAITDVFTAQRGALDAFVERFERLPGQRGMVVAADSRIWAVDYVADEEVFAGLFPRLLRGYALDAMRSRPGTRISREELEVALARLWTRPLAREESEGPEERYRFGGEGLSVEGTATRFGGRLVALNALLPGAPQGAGGEQRLRTSETSPIEVSWLHAGRGALGITMAPGKRARSARGGPHERDLELDLVRLRRSHRVDTLVCLLEDHEIERLGMSGYEERVASAGIELLRMPVVEGCVPSSMRATRELVGAVLERLERGARVVIHDRRGLGRAGTLGGCVLVAGGRCDGAGALERLRQRRGSACPETEAQRAFVQQFAKRAPLESAG